jgi:hypothetical protein
MKKRSNIFNNQSLLYFLFILTLVQITYLIFVDDKKSIFVYAVIIFITYLVNPNMIFVLGISLLSINLLTYFNINIPVYEGMENEILKPNCTQFKKQIYERINIALNNDTDVSNNIPANAIIFCNKIKKQYVDAETDYDFYEYYKNNFNYITEQKTINWIEDNIYKSSDFKYIKCNIESSALNESVEVINDKKKVNPPISSFNNEYDKNNINEDKTDPNHIENVMNRLQQNTPDIIDSLKILNSIDINQVNSLINNLNSIAGSFNKTSN